MYAHSGKLVALTVTCCLVAAQECSSHEQLMWQGQQQRDSVEVASTKKRHSK